MILFFVLLYRNLDLPNLNVKIKINSFIINLKYLFTYLFIFLNFILFSQSKTDSLTDILHKTKDSLILAQTYKELADINKSVDKNIAIQYINQGINVSKKNKNDSLTADLIFSKAQLYDYFEEWETSKTIYYQSAKYYQLINDSVNISKCYNNTGVTNYYYGNYEQAIIDLNIAIFNSKNSADFKNTAKAYNNLALVYKAQGNYTDAINTYIQSLKLKEKAGDKNGMANTYQNIGVLFWEQENMEEALNSYNKAVAIFKEIGDTIGIGNIYGNIGLVYKKENDTATAMKYYNKAINLLEKINYTQGLATALLNKGTIINESGNIGRSEVYFLKSLTLFEQISFNTGIMMSKVSLSRLYSKQGNHDKSFKYASEAVEIADKSNSLKYLAESYLILSKNYIDIKQYNKAYNYLNKYHLIKDSLFTLKKNKQINIIKTKYETEKKETKIELLEKESKIQILELDKKNKNLRTISIILILTFGFLMILIILFFQKRKAYLSLVEHNVELAKKDIETEKQIRNQNIKPSEKSNIKKKYSDSQLDKIQKKELTEDIVLLMEEEKFFLNSGFTINDFAKELKTNRNYISQIINEYFNTNFNSFVNEYRVKEARKLLISEDYKNYSIEGIASTVGFHNKATFNTAFKKFTGVTPSFFQKNRSNF